MQEIIENNEEIILPEDASDAPDTVDDIEESDNAEGFTDEADEKAQESFSLTDEIDELRAEHPDVVVANTNVDPERYQQLRAMGLTMKEAYLATSERSRTADNKRHLTDSMPKSARSPATAMTRREMELARVLFDGMSDEQIKKLYNRVKS